MQHPFLTLTINYAASFYYLKTILTPAFNFSAQANVNFYGKLIDNPLFLNAQISCFIIAFDYSLNQQTFITKNIPFHLNLINIRSRWQIPRIPLYFVYTRLLIVIY